MSPQIAIFKPSIFPIFIFIVIASNKAWVGCSLQPSPALITEQLTFLDKRFAAPESPCLITRRSGCIALSVIAVSIKVSPFFIAEFETFMFITSAPRRLPASSNDDKVLVELSKNKLICVFPFSKLNFLFSFLFSSTNDWLSFSMWTISGIDKSWIPKRCFFLYLTACLVLNKAIKTSPIGLFL